TDETERVRVFHEDSLSVGAPAAGGKDVRRKRRDREDSTHFSLLKSLSEPTWVLFPSVRARERRRAREPKHPGPFTRLCSSEQPLRARRVPRARGTQRPRTSPR